ncbi:hypothetical protein P0Y35_04670 [Kiritimatiellaeota bacterium B1221]|nr:hypothetical protein [Kiritimatiellaeota bacterium B1221]
MQKHSLNGTWELYYSDGERGRPPYFRDPDYQNPRGMRAEVPGCVHTDLIRQGMIQDPVNATNALQARWVEECIWTYRKTFEVAQTELHQNRCWLHFEKLDLNAEIYLNGKRLGSHHNVYLPCRFEVSEFLRAGINSLVVHIESGLIGAGDKPAAGLGASHSDYDYAKNLHKSHWLRKPNFQFGWDWSTRLVNVGISGSVTLETSEKALRTDSLQSIVTVSEDLNSATLTLRARVENLTGQELDICLQAEIPELNTTFTKTLTCPPKEHQLEVQVSLCGFELWWPAGSGAQKLYTLKTCIEHAEEAFPFPERKIGFRHIKVQEDPHPDGGNFCVLEVNHRPIFLKGACWIPPDMLMSRIDDTRVHRLLDLAREANFNFLRVWGGGCYESDGFYERCDALGLLVWQDFGFACKQYPLTDKALHVNATDEARYQVRRLSGYPSLALLCGNNEMEWANWEWDFNREVVMPDYGFFHHTLPRIMQDEAPGILYRASSPQSPGDAHSNLDDRGDQHNWHVSFENSDYRAYRKMDCRMITEAGFLGPPSLPTLQKCWAPESPPRIGDFSWFFHDNSIDSWHRSSMPDQAFLEHIGKPIQEFDIATYVYIGGLLHGEALSTFADNFRSKAFDSSAAIFWMFNDCWPCARSWTIVDYATHRTPAFWAIKRAFAPLHLSIRYLCESHEYVFHLSNDSQEPFMGSFDCGFCFFAGDRKPHPSREVKVPANSKTELIRLPADLAPEKETSKFVYGFLKDSDENLIDRNRYLGPRLCELELPDPHIEMELADGRLTFTSDVFALGVSIDLDGKQALADNFFDLYPGQPYTIPWPQADIPEVKHGFNFLSRC